MRHLGPDTHVIAVCQPAPLALAATAYLAAEDPTAQPRSLTLIGGPIDPDAAATDVTDFGRRVTMGQLESIAIQRVGFKYKGVGRLVYPGLLQLQSFMSMNAERHKQGLFRPDHARRQGRGFGSRPAQPLLRRIPRRHGHDRRNSTCRPSSGSSKGCEIAKNEFVVAGKKVDIGTITNVAVMTVEGENDDISAPGQCVAALALLTGLPDAKKTQHLEPGAGHYGIFAGKSWRMNIRPLVLKFIDAHSGTPKVTKLQTVPAISA